jgi:hypothetical protein
MSSPLKLLLASGTAFDYAIIVQCSTNGSICTIIPIMAAWQKQYFPMLAIIKIKKACADYAQAFHRS